MNQEIKARWVEALRSGEYAQTQGSLQRVVAKPGRAAGFCCLGVLCDIAVQDGVVRVYPERSESIVHYGAQNDFSGAYLPASVQEWSALESMEGFYVTGGQIKQVLSEDQLSEIDEDIETYSSYSLADLNDRGASFEAIALLIEAYA